MAENESLTPEKQLLKLIENPKQASVRAENAKREGKKWFSFSAFKGRLDFWKNFSVKKNASSGKFSKGSFSVERINFILRVLLVAVAIYAIYNTWGMFMGIKKASQLILKTPSGASTEQSEPAASFQTINYYLEKIKGRNIFSSVKAEEKPKKVEKAAPLAPGEKSPIQGLSLVGIAWSNNPEAMVEDKETGHTFFVRRGQTIANSFKVVTVFKDRVILNYQDKEYELT